MTFTCIKNFNVFIFSKWLLLVTVILDLSCSKLKSFDWFLLISPAKSYEMSQSKPYPWLKRNLTNEKRRLDVRRGWKIHSSSKPGF